MARYQGRVSGPLLDRIDLRVEVGEVAPEEIEQGNRETSAQVRARVNAARMLQQRRYAREGIYANAQLSASQLRRWAEPDAAGRALLAGAMRRWGLSMRGRDRVRKVARTIADLDGAERVEARHIAEALQYRAMETEA